ncbi:MULTISPECIES: creatininase family protein [Halorubrum]|uniref:Creatininase n=1 Tax=Halorubrum hochstenium ATCC 700873 TaxID=1227481 RepID=M0FIG9_9EURY|nr:MULTISPECIES: creatininase family protein [Halorubrum]ELZ59108.1 creatininase [Halorubrum hochstenium ATCC 700873]
MPETDADLSGMTWEEADAAVDDADFAVLPTGSIEQHGPHLPVSTDTLRADHLTAELVDAADESDLDLLRLPPLPYGQSEHHMRFPGTVTLSTETYVDVVRDIGESVAAHGVDRLLLLNCHGGNREPLSVAADRLGRDTDLTVHFVHWTDFAREDLESAYGEGWGHAGDHETSFVELYRPDLVRTERKEPQEAAELPETRSYEYFDEVTELGGLGDPTNSDPDALEPIVAETTRAILDALVADLDAGW